MLVFRIRSLEHMAALGRALAGCLCAEPSLRCILLRGDLGSGKTTLTRFLVEALPGGDGAEISSPSFTLCNVYPTMPPVLHCDLYRVGGAVPDELGETLDAGDMAVLVEWAEYLPVSYLPQDFLDIYFQVSDDFRLVCVTIHSPHSARVECLLQAAQFL
ncbi:MAG: tRNA (adenosine(37)-N6)-threonylcarbamoyltransferase complex ATPase subunit type 1 TsaE [Deltaproteobacteria bacterium]|jgi:tRNA threonylcarbamoyladenosine biosynthesis protein TsaE|nr:tRNA (adenosine(37)-N6)-threonylcarbamoyltransferase complex ATPase subunit type 1 TsaE [Deltaproteobacteria bacterium]